MNRRTLFVFVGGTFTLSTAGFFLSVHDVPRLIFAVAICLYVPGFAALGYASRKHNAFAVERAATFLVHLSISMAFFLVCFVFLAGMMGGYFVFASMMGLLFPLPHLVYQMYLMHWATLLFFAGYTDAAVKHMNGVLHRLPANAEAYRLRGNFHALKNNAAPAIHDYNRAVKLIEAQPNSALFRAIHHSLYVALFWLNLEQKNYPQA